jgi:hypothetical protein
LAQLILKMCPSQWQDQYALTQGNIPQDLRSLLVILEVIENSQEKVPKKIPGKPNGKTGEGGNSDKKKRKKVSFKEDRSSKKARTKDKHCDLCMKHGGHHTTHNTGDCFKYEKDGTKKKAFRKAKFETKNQNFAQIMKDGFAKMTKALMKDKKSKMKCRKYDSDSNSS